VSALLLDEPPLVIQPSLVRALGFERALVLQQLHYWLQRTNHIDADGTPWTYQSARELSQQLPIAERTIRRALVELRRQGWIRAAMRSTNPRDRTFWYTIHYPKVDGPSGLRGRMKPAAEAGSKRPPGPDVDNVAKTSSETSSEKLALSASPSKYTQGFETWYKAHPVHKGKRDAYKAWQETRKDRPPLAQMLFTLAWQRRLPEWVKDGGKWVGRPATYLRAGSWEDEPTLRS